MYNDHNNTFYFHSTYLQELFEMAYKIKYFLKEEAIMKGK